MVKRASYRTTFYMIFALLVLLVSWEHNLSMAAVVEPEIPEQSIRLRILANSDSIEDQALKRQVRDAVVEQMNSWVTGPMTLDEARAMVSERLPELEAVVGRVIQEHGYDYGYKAELGVVPFPAKMYGSRVYPAGDYEALRITIGSGAGQNWWCVLFPPLCFVDAGEGDAVEKQAAGASGAAVQTAKNKAVKEKDSASKAVKDADNSAGKAKKEVKAAGSVEKAKSSQAVLADEDGQPLKAGEAPEGKKKVRFFFWEKIKGWFA